MSSKPKAQVFECDIQTYDPDKTMHVIGKYWRSAYQGKKKSTTVSRIYFSSPDSTGQAVWAVEENQWRRCHREWGHVIRQRIRDALRLGDKATSLSHPLDSDEEQSFFPGNPEEYGDR